MGTYIVIGSDGKEYGPIPADDVRQWIADGRINAQTKAQVAGTGEWKLLAEFPEFSDVRKSPLAPPSLPAATPAKTSGMAITSLVLAIVGLFSCGITAVLGLIFGIIALIKVRNSGGRLSGFGFALTASAINWTDGVNHIFGGQASAGGNYGFAGRERAGLYSCHDALALLED